MATLGGIVFTAILVWAAIGDVRSRRIPNRLVGILAVLGIVFSVVRAPVLSGFLSSGSGILVGLACWLPFYALGWLGAGDVKLFAAAGAWLGPERAVEGALIGALSGAALSLLWMMKSRGVRETVETLGMAAVNPELLSPEQTRLRSSLPYGVAIAFGAICAGWLPRLFLL